MTLNLAVSLVYDERPGNKRKNGQIGPQENLKLSAVKDTRTVFTE